MTIELKSVALSRITSTVRITIVMPAFNEEKLIADALRHVQTALVAFTRRGWETELIVCDNNSTDRTAELARSAGAQVVFEPINSIAGARNRGARAATGDWLIFSDADSYPSEGLFDDVANAIASGRCLAGSCNGKLDERYFRADCIMTFWNWASRKRRLLAGFFIFCETKVFWELGGFDSRLYMSEDIDLSVRLRKPARAQGKEVVILDQHPILTSARKVRLYGLGKYLWFWMKTVLTFGRTLKDPKACNIWYDGKR